MFTDIEQAIVEKLKAALPGVYVLTADELSDIEESKQPTPAVHVIYNGYRVKDSLPNGKVSHISQIWMTVIAVRNVSQRGTGSAARIDAIALAEKIAPAMMGFKPENAASPLTLQNAPAPAGGNGFLYVPLAWSVDTVLNNKDQ